MDDGFSNNFQNNNEFNENQVEENNVNEPNSFGDSFGSKFSPIGVDTQQTQISNQTDTVSSFENKKEGKKIKKKLGKFLKLFKWKKKKKDDLGNYTENTTVVDDNVQPFPNNFGSEENNLGDNFSSEGELKKEAEIDFSNNQELDSPVKSAISIDLTQQPIIRDQFSNINPNFDLQNNQSMVENITMNETSGIVQNNLMNVGSEEKKVEQVVDNTPNNLSSEMNFQENQNFENSSFSQGIIENKQPEVNFENYVVKKREIVRTKRKAPPAPATKSAFGSIFEMLKNIKKVSVETSVSSVESGQSSNEGKFSNNQSDLPPPIRMNFNQRKENLFSTLPKNENLISTQPLYVDNTPPPPPPVDKQLNITSYFSLSSNTAPPVTQKANVYQPPMQMHEKKSPIPPKYSNIKWTPPPPISQKMDVRNFNRPPIPPSNRPPIPSSSSRKKKVPPVPSTRVKRVPPVPKGRNPVQTQQPKRKKRIPISMGVNIPRPPKSKPPKLNKPPSRSTPFHQKRVINI